MDQKLLNLKSGSGKVSKEDGGNKGCKDIKDSNYSSKEDGEYKGR
jgi:hypothetical protein